MLDNLYQMLDPIAVQIGPLQIRWYGLAYVAGFICAFLILGNLSKRWRVRINEDAFFVIVFSVILGVIIGGRAGYVLFYGDGYYLQHPEKILRIQRRRNELSRRLDRRARRRIYRLAYHAYTVFDAC